jgi:multidrug efflux pump subunit AcrA (membrane-fusion protein)
VKISGRSIAINVDQGDMARRGQTLTQLEHSESNAEVDRAVANMERPKQ